MTDNSTSRKADTQSDIVIGGGGYVGLLAAAALASADTQLSITLVDPRHPDMTSGDRRASAIAGGARNMLEQLGLWNELRICAEPIRKMIVTDSRLRDTHRPVFLTFDTSADGAAPLAHMIENNALIEALRRRVAMLGVILAPPDRIVDFAPAKDNMTLRVALAGGGTLHTRLLIAADGVRSQLREMSGISMWRIGYDQAGIVTTLAHEHGHESLAEEHFLPAGPFAVLPLKGRRVSLVWTERKSLATALAGAGDRVLRPELRQRLGGRLGSIGEIGPRAIYPLGLALARDYVRPRLALIGDAAHAIHPIAGQGLNLGFKDAAALAEIVINARRRGEDIGAIDVLERYQRWRRFDNWRMGVTTDLINRLFSNDAPALRLVRTLGLGLVDRLAPLKGAFMREAAGHSARAPRLIENKPI